MVLIKDQEFCSHFALCTSYTFIFPLKWRKQALRINYMMNDVIMHLRAQYRDLSASGKACMIPEKPRDF